MDRTPLCRPPDRLAATITVLYGESGREWLERLPATIAYCEQRWGLTALPAVDELSYNYVAPAILSDGSAAILKLGVPPVHRNPEFSSEIEALRRFDGQGCVRLLEADQELGAMLLERAEPGTTLAEVADDDQATRVAAQVMRRLWRAVDTDHPFPTVELWGRGFTRLRLRFDGGTGPLPPRLTDKAERLFGELQASSQAAVLLHGDLHHWNVLRAQREPWLAIDPKGLVGEPAYEVGALLRNMVDPLRYGEDPVRVTRRRLAILEEELSIDRHRLQAWGFAQAVLSAWWDIEDGTADGSLAIEMAAIIDQAVSCHSQPHAVD